MKYTPIDQFDIELLKQQLESTMQEKFLKICLNALDTEVTPDNPVPNEFSCAWDVSVLINKLPNFEFKKHASTKMLDSQLFLDKRFSRLTEPSLGSIWIYPAKTNSKGDIIVYGHALVQITSDRLASNNSIGKDKGKFTGNYTIEEARKEFVVKRGLKEYIYGFKN
jgi:hypothetical protein